MFRNIYRAMVLSRTKSAAIQVANQLSQRDLNDIGYSRSEIVHNSVESVRKEFDQADLERANRAIRYPNHGGLSSIYRLFRTNRPA